MKKTIEEKEIKSSKDLNNVKNNVTKTINNTEKNIETYEKYLYEIEEGKRTPELI